MRNCGKKKDGKRIPTKTPDPRVFKPGYVILEGDYETATDYIEWGAARHVCKRYLRHLKILSPYVELCINLLTSPRIIHPEMVITKRGVLMGDPGSKIILSILSRVSHQLNIPLNRPRSEYEIRSDPA